MRKAPKFIIAVAMVLLILCTSVFATIGQQLSAPETGWSRFDDTDSNISYSSKLVYSTNGDNWYNNTIHFCSATSNSMNENFKFNFQGTKLRLIGITNPDKSRYIQVKIDGKVMGTFTQRNDTRYTYYVFYEITGLDLKEHYLEVTSLDNGTSFVLDAVDIDASGALKPYREVPNAPTNLTATAGDKTVDLSWTAVSGATSYNVKRATSAEGQYETIKTDINTTSYQDTAVANGIIYYYVVTAVTANGESGYSTKVSATPEVAISGVPVNLTATSGNGLIGLTWDAVSGEVSYNVKRATTAGGQYETIKTGITTPSYTDTAVTNGTTYYYVVTAVNAGGESANSNEASGTPIEATGGPALLRITMTNGAEKEYEMTGSEISAFINWYNVKAGGIGTPYYIIDKQYNKGPFTSRKDYIVFDKILNFEVMEY